MPTQTSCPLSEVDRALSSYINSREKTLQRRKALAKYFTANLRPVNATKNQHFRLECPHDSFTTNTNPPALEGSRLAYLNALRVRAQSQARLSDLRSSLEELQNRHALESPGQGGSEYDNEVTRGYVALLRQRRRISELQVIQEALEKLLNSSHSSATQDLKILVKEAIGEQPDLPAQRLDQFTQPHDGENSILKLKQEVLDARASMDRANKARGIAENQSRAPPRLEDQVYALGCARDEIVEWVQNELAKMEEESQFLEDASPIKQPIGEAQFTDLNSSEAQIRDSYDRYISSRSEVLAAHDSIQQGPCTQLTPVNNPNGPAQTTGGPAEHLNPRTIITGLLPHIPHLTHTAENERSLLRQNVHLQSQISSADEEITDSLLRLSGESHLLPSGSKETKAWGLTAKEVEAATEDFVKDQLQESRQEVSSVATIVDLCSLQSKVLASR